MRTKPSANTTTVDRELARVRRLLKHKCEAGGECCPACLDSFRRRGFVEAHVGEIETANV